MPNAAAVLVITRTAVTAWFSLLSKLDILLFASVRMTCSQNLIFKACDVYIRIGHLISNQLVQESQLVALTFLCAGFTLYVHVASAM